MLMDSALTLWFLLLVAASPTASGQTAHDSGNRAYLPIPVEKGSTNTGGKADPPLSSITIASGQISIELSKLLSDWAKAHPDFEPGCIQLGNPPPPLGSPRPVEDLISGAHAIVGGRIVGSELRYYSDVDRLYRFLQVEIDQVPPRYGTEMAGLTGAEVTSPYAAFRTAESVFCSSRQPDVRSRVHGPPVGSRVVLLLPEQAVSKAHPRIGASSMIWRQGDDVLDGFGRDLAIGVFNFLSRADFLEGSL